MGRRCTWSDADKQTLREMWAAGASQAVIGRRLGRPVNAVSTKITALGLRGIVRAAPGHDGPSVETRTARRRKPTPASLPASAPHASSRASEIRPQIAPCEARPAGGKPAPLASAPRGVLPNDLGRDPRCLRCEAPSRPGTAFCASHGRRGFVHTAPDVPRAGHA